MGDLAKYGPNGTHCPVCDGPRAAKEWYACSACFDDRFIGSGTAFSDCDRCYASHRKGLRSHCPKHATNLPNPEGTKWGVWIVRFSDGTPGDVFAKDAYGACGPVSYSTKEECEADIGKWNKGGVGPLYEPRPLPASTSPKAEEPKFAKLAKGQVFQYGDDPCTIVVPSYLDFARMLFMHDHHAEILHIAADRMQGETEIQACQRVAMRMWERLEDVEKATYEDAARTFAEWAR